MSDFTAAPVKPVVPFSALEVLDIRIGTIERVEDVPRSEKLLKLTVNFGDHRRTILAGMKQERENPREVEGKQALFVLNLETKKMAGRNFPRHAVRSWLRGWNFAGPRHPGAAPPQWHTRRLGHNHTLSSEALSESFCIAKKAPTSEGGRYTVARGVRRARNLPTYRSPWLQHPDCAPPATIQTHPYQSELQNLYLPGPPLDPTTAKAPD